MGRRSSVTTKKDIDGFRIKRNCLGRISKNKLIAFDPSVRMESWRKFNANLWVGVQSRRHSVRGPTLEKSFSLGNSGQGSQLQTTTFSRNQPPAFRSKFTQ